MKKYMIFAAFAAALLMGGCAKEPVTGDETAPVKTVLKASLSPLTKTEINGVKVTWSAGDAINVNGAVSNALTEAAEKATFGFRRELTAPFKAIYPTSLYKDATTVTLPGNIGVDAFDVPLYGYAESGDEIPFSALTALVKLTVTGEATTTLKDITLTALGGEQLAGDFAIDYATGALTGASEAEADKEIKVTVGKALSSEALTVYIPVPAGTYASGYQVDLVDAEGKIMRKAVTARTLKAGELRIMPDLAYEPNVEEAENIGGIPDAAELKAFAAAVNDGLSISRWLNEAGEVELLADIDLGGQEWVPIGNGSVTTGNAISGAAFEGIFNGGGHTIDNFTVTMPADAANAAGGLFGIVKGATIKDLTIGSKAVLKNESTSGFVTLGAVVGFAAESTLENLDSYASLGNAEGKGKNETRLVLGGTIGSMFSSATVACSAKDIKGHASFSVFNSVNGKNGGTGFIVGGVIGWTDGMSLDYATTITNAVNYSDFSVQATRTAGVIGTMNSYSKAEGCINYGKIECTDVTASNSRVAGIVSAMGSNVTLIKDCVNYGDVIFAVSGDQTHGYAGGVIGQNNADTTIDGCENYGAVLSDRWFASPDKYMGIISGNFNTKTIVVKNCVLGGKIGPYTPTATDPIVELTESNFDQYYSLIAEARLAKVTYENNTFGGAPAQPGISTAEDLVAFAAAVNAGESIEQWESDGVVKLLNDIDCSSITEWTPIGNVTSAGNANNASSPTGPVFSGVFDGNSHTIKNFTATKAITDNGVFGLFGYIQNATVKNLTVEANLTLSAAATADAGVVAGTANSSTVENVNVTATLTGNGADVDNKRFTIGGIAGFVYGTSSAPSTIKNCTVNATSVIKSGANTKNGATCVHYGGIVGFATTASGTTATAVTIEGCTNNGSITATCGRSSGILGVANLGTLIKSCTNNASHFNDFANGRIAQIVCNLAGYSGVVDCVNNGNLTTTDIKTTTGGMVALFGNNTCYLEGGTNTGTIITGFDPSTDGSSRNFSGIIGANINLFDHVSGFVVSGRFGHYKADGNHEMVTLTESNFRDYIGYRTNANDAKITGLTFVAAE